LAVALGLGGVALSLAVVGVIGASAFAVVRRRAEIGVRVALGARRRQIALLLLGPLMRSIATGLTIGVGLSIVGWHLVGRTLPIVDIAGAMPFAIAALILLVAAASAVVVPVRRALSIEPAETLRQN
jgi:predicted lysophospholipase L1 biosynthesis ABC-type transport system permease subunit